MKGTIVGVQRITGVSEKSGTPKPYDISRVNVLEPQESMAKENFSRDAHGFGLAEVDCTPEVVEKFKSKQFPFSGELITQDRLAYGRLVSTVVDIK